MNINLRLAKLREKMSEVGVGICLIPTSDCHDSEYICEYYKTREYFSGFTGSAGSLIVTLKDAALFTDGRYFIQAQKQLSSTEITLMKMGEEGVPGINEYIVQKMSEGDILGFDGRVVNAAFAQNLADRLKEKGCGINYKFDPAENAWENRPPIEFKDVFILDEKYAGECASDKIAAIFEYMKEKGADSHIVTSLDDIAWILNLRGDDVKYCPVFFAYMVFVRQECHLYARIDEKRTDVLLYLKKIGVFLHDYDEFFEDGLQRVNNCTKQRLLYDKTRISYLTFMTLREGLDYINAPNPSTLKKCIKNPVEIANIMKANVKDGVAVVKFERWLEEELRARRKSLETGSTTSASLLNEITISDKLEEMRRAEQSFIEPSFETISAYGSNGAIIHYAATKDSNAQIVDGSFLMLDSGGHYYEGTTDVTRTYAIGEVSDKLKQDYTLVLRCMLKLMNLTFPYGARGNNLDVEARSLLWSKGLDFKHGTGHGIGYLSDVHEGPNRISWKIPENSQPGVIYEAGMLTSDEPGLYFEGKYGIRIETDILCVEKFSNEYGRFMGFIPMTYVPIDMTAIYKPDMTPEDIAYLDEYHKTVYEKLSPYLSGDDLEYLKEKTKCFNSI